ncbi:glycosyltransferase family 4 protein [Desulfomarina profundi]|uniref:glycosyltransferase family 4 protein n=1 Tax=Desulfomarina profundi TaxID=2772557 RepID=UPI001E4725EA|nr:glycosyltransferase family 4 protein [Desulfomarina profundi]
MTADTVFTDRKILVLAPQPFFQERGTPIAVKLLVEELARLGFDVHLLVFHEGEDVAMDGVTLHRIPAIPGIKNIPPSISFKKIICDGVMFFSMVRLLKKYDFDLVHAVEESVFLVRVVSLFSGIPYVYDMDSSLVIQMVDKLSFLRPFRSLLRFFERSAVRGSNGVMAVCRELEEIARDYASEKRIARLEDISLLDENAHSAELLWERYDISGPIMLYVGNLEGYQGIDLLLESFQLARLRGCQGNLVIIGGTEETIAKYREKAQDLEIGENTVFCGMRPVSLLAHYLRQADILLSPRIQGNNTPMKLYSYLASGKVVLATRLPTHTQVLDDGFACLVEPVAESMAAAMVTLLEDKDLRERLGKKGREVAEQNHSIGSFRKKLKAFYQGVIDDMQ